jgi:hypothetical protein
VNDASPSGAFPRRRRWPSGFTPGQKRAAAERLTIALVLGLTASAAASR